MLELKKITKEYITKDLKQIALDDISISFRKTEFAAILGHSGSGKTTLLNIIGGLDKYDKGDLIINEVSTKKYKDKDWDTYRNHRVGFVFQSYNLISHQSILENVELALTLSGIKKRDRRKMALDALDSVGLLRHKKKKPSQLSGGQMQRVAIARSLVNNPDIILADEPTGALDSETSKQIMDLLKKVSEDKLVIMVTHNPELANIYANRIINLRDGKIISDSNPYKGEENTKENSEIKKEKNKKTSMNLFTALSLSLNNLLTKKGRTILTSFAGSIGIIGIALILSLSNGVQDYIDKTEKETLATYPLTIENTVTDITTLMESANNNINNKEECQENKVCTVDDITNNVDIKMNSLTTKNNLEKFKVSLDNNYKNIKDYVTDIKYIYDLELNIYNIDTDNGIKKINPDALNLTGEDNSNTNMPGMSLMTKSFSELINNTELLKGQYEVLAGKMPTNYNELVIVVNENNEIPASILYSLDILKREELSEVLKKVKNGENIKLTSTNFNYGELIGSKYKLILNTDYYKKNGNIWQNYEYDENFMESIINDGLTLEIVGLMKVANSNISAESGFVGYTTELTNYVIKNINDSKIAKDQINNKNINVFTNKKFDGLTSTYEINSHILGLNDLNNPYQINIYPRDYDAKESIENIIKDYNKEQSSDDKITYNDYVGVLMSSVTTIVDIITYVLIAFVAISLVVSSIMIAIITYISVLERTKEIGILRAIGASKKDVRRVFVAETIIEGFVAGFMGIMVTILLCIPINAILYPLIEVKNIASLPMYGAIGLIIISMILTIIAGLIPSKMASKKDPVEALRSE